MRIKFEIGDRWDDGHGKYDTIYVDSNKTQKELEAAFTISQINTKINFQIICSDYEDSSLPDSVVDVLDEFGIKYDDLVERGYNSDVLYFEDGPLGYAELVLRFIKFSLPDLEYKIIGDDAVPIFNSQLIGGYGLFY